MNAENLLRHLVERGFRLAADGETLRVAPAAKLDESLRHQIATHKAALLDLLAPNTDLSEAERTARIKFPGRVRAVVPHGATGAPFTTEM